MLHFLYLVAHAVGTPLSSILEGRTYTDSVEPFLIAIASPIPEAQSMRNLLCDSFCDAVALQFRTGVALSRIQVLEGPFKRVTHEMVTDALLAQSIGI